MTPADLIAAGHTLYGPVWQSALARALRNADGDPLSDRMVRYWLEGKRPISVWAEKQMLGLLVEQQVRRIDEVLSSVALKDVGGFTFTIYESDDDLRRCTGDQWTAEFHSKMMGGVIERLRDRGIDSRAIPMSAPAYFKWLDDRPNTAAERSAFAGLQTGATH